MRTLYEINEEILKVFETLEIDEETGEILNLEELEKLEIERDAKFEGTACYIKSLIAMNEAIKEEEDRLKSRRKSRENKVEKLKQYLDNALKSCNKTSFETARCKITFRKSESVELAEALESLPEEYKKTKITIEPDKTAIKTAIKAGTEVPGAILVQKQNIQIK